LVSVCAESFQIPPVWTDYLDNTEMNSTIQKSQPEELPTTMKKEFDSGKG